MHVPYASKKSWCKMERKLEGRDILSLKDFSREEIEFIFETAKKKEPIARSRSDILRDKVLGSLFFQSSTRTRLSHETAMLRLGGSVTGWAEGSLSRAGDYMRETLADTARTVQSYVDVVVMRHPQDGAPAIFAEYADIPVINAGDGRNEHPTQALLDLYTIWKERGKIDGLKVAIIGFMADRVFHSFAYGLAKFDDIQLYLMCPEETRWPAFDRELEKLRLNFEYSERLEDIISELDVINIVTSGLVTTTIFDLSEYGKIWTTTKRSPPQYKLTLDKLKKGKKDLMVLHCLPRHDEVPTEIDNTPYAKYFIQPYNGLVTRMALLALVLGRTS